jgi:death-on-curing protein
LAEVRYLTLDEVIGLHDKIVEWTGSPECSILRAQDLESVLAKPRNAAWYEGADLIRQAVLLIVGISQCQAFLDGNKRAAFAAADVFLRINGLVFEGDPMELAMWLEYVAESSRDLRDVKTDEFESWVRSFVLAKRAETDG